MCIYIIYSWARGQLTTPDRFSYHTGPRACFIRPSEQVKNTRNFFCMTEILLMNLNFIQLSTNLQLITIRNSSYGKNIKPPWAPAEFFPGGANPETSLHVHVCSKVEGHICL